MQGLGCRQNRRSLLMGERPQWVGSGLTATCRFRPQLDIDCKAIPFESRANDYMALASLHQAVISAVMDRLLGWKFVKSTRDFVQLHGTCKWYVHLSFANYGNNFNVAMDVAVEHLMKKQRICILGAELGTIRGTGWHTWNV